MFVFYLYAAVLIGILIIVHELGHFAAARASRVTVERFSIGFGPKIFTIKRGETEYAISAIPLGGYVKMAGTEISEHPTEASYPPNTFPGKRAAVRALIVAAGPIANVFWAFLVYVGIVWVGGVPTFGDEPVVGMVEPDTPAAAAGVHVLDRVLSVDGSPVESWDDLRSGIQSADLTDGITLRVERPGEAEPVTLVVRAAPDSQTGAVAIGVAAYIPPVIGDVMKESPADLAGLKRGDRVTSIDGEPVLTWYQLSQIVSDNPKKDIKVDWVRGGRDMRATMKVDETQEAVDLTTIENVGTIGVTVPLMMERVGFGEAVVSAARVSASTAYQVVSLFGMIIAGRVSMNMIGGPIRVVQMASESARWGASYFFAFMAYLSLNLAVINLLPLPILDGGHLLLLALERIRRRGLTEKQLLVWQQIGLVFFVGLAIFLLARDVFMLR